MIRYSRCPAMRLGLFALTLAFVVWRGIDPGPATASLEDMCAPNVLLIRFDRGVVSFPDEIDYGHDHFTLPIEDATFEYPELELGLLAVGVETFETIAPNWRHITDDELFDRHGNPIELVDFTDVYRVVLDHPPRLHDLIEHVEALPGVAYVECDRLFRMYYDPNDSLYSEQWHLNSGGQVVDEATCDSFYDINAPEAWDIWDSAGTKIGIVDGGILGTHEDLRGYIDASLSRDFSNADSGWCDVGHGTAVAGLAAAGTNNTLGVAGVAGLDPNHGDSILVALRVKSWNESTPDEGHQSGRCGRELPDLRS